MSEGSSIMSSDWLGAFLIIAILFGGGSFFGGGRGPAPNFATTQDVNDAVNNQATQQGIQNLLISSANNNFETQRSIDNQTMFLSNQNNTNALAAVNGFNAVNLNMSNGFAEVRSQVAALDAKMSQCCCEIKTLIKDNQIAELLRENNKLQNEAVNAAQTQTILSTMGKWVANAPAAAAG